MLFTVEQRPPPYNKMPLTSELFSTFVSQVHSTYNRGEFPKECYLVVQMHKFSFIIIGLCKIIGQWRKQKE